MSCKHQNRAEYGPITGWICGDCLTVLSCEFEDLKRNHAALCKDYSVLRKAMMDLMQVADREEIGKMKAVLVELSKKEEFSESRWEILQSLIAVQALLDTQEPT